MEQALLLIIPLAAGYLLDLLVGDPENLPHPVRVFGNLIYKGEQLLNKLKYRFLKGMLLTLALCLLTFFTFSTVGEMLLSLHPYLYLLFAGIFVFYGLANRGLVDEGRKVFQVLHTQGLEAGRKQLSRIVGRDTSQLSPQQIRIAVLETMSENLSDGVIAPLFYFALAGVPGMMTYKMINTMDSMLGYRNDRYEQFGKFAARLDDVANFIPARITALLMALVSICWQGLVFVLKYGNKHKSPNAGYPEAALAGILNCQFGGPNVYHGVLVDKPYIGEQDRVIKHQEIYRVSRINHGTCFVMVAGIMLMAFLVL
ncbi:adenosylcobinamide-phosphate synthase CbiB [Pontibacter silvestris]|uniref:Cobalamin biosynthesis protein CobD n=1 Tax=Pontibacter silvestris TaxID=2305183 RepID=A0ABW4X091_9BACT|nr:adenosylcobinamide-phosphate synthase CbiB [Pontibacter silvestris]MCC9138217.1 adenosylcobinamide-phosphate synthase CbiB [Pontibacter silvestris]